MKIKIPFSLLLILRSVRSPQTRTGSSIIFPGPEGVEFFTNVLGQSNRMLANPRFRMKPFNRSGLQCAVDGAIVLVRRPDGTAVMEGGPVEVEGEIVLTQNGKEVHQQTKSQSKVSLASVTFRQFDGR